MEKHYSIAKTTRAERQKIVDEALAMTTLDAPEPTPETKKLLAQYVNGKLEIPEILEKTIARYKRTGEE